LGSDDEIAFKMGVLPVLSLLQGMSKSGEYGEDVMNIAKKAFHEEVKVRKLRASASADIVVNKNVFKMAVATKTK
jgi:hypothetical protein